MSGFDKDFRGRAEQMLDWVQDYAAGIADMPVRSQVSPGDILSRLPDQAPDSPQDYDQIMQGLTDILPGITHWQHPRFFAYFPSNNRPESLLAEIAMAAMGVNAMLWETSPAATEMEMRTTDWLRNAMGLPAHWRGVIQDTASNATFAAVLAARERSTEGRANLDGLRACPPLAYYVSAEAHSSIEKAVRMAGVGSNAVRVVPTKGDARAMDADALRAMMAADKAAGIIPAALMITAGGTGVGAFDRADELIPIAREYGAYVHVDAAWAGSVMICDEYRDLFKGCELADSFVFNPHKWLGIGFECSVQFLADPKQQISALSMKPAYLESVDGVTDYADWSPVLGRRNRGLKAWMVLSLVGLDQMRREMRDHIHWTNELAERVAGAEGFEIVTEPNLALFTFRYRNDQATLDLIEAVNNDGRAYLTKTIVDGRPVIRWTIGCWRTTEVDVNSAFQTVKTIAEAL